MEGSLESGTSYLGSVLEVMDPLRQALSWEGRAELGAEIMSGRPRSKRVKNGKEFEGLCRGLIIHSGRDLVERGPGEEDGIDQVPEPRRQGVRRKSEFPLKFDEPFRPTLAERTED